MDNLDRSRDAIAFIVESYKADYAILNKDIAEEAVEGVCWLKTE